MRLMQRFPTGALLLEPTIYSDRRGTFHEWFRPEAFRQATGEDVTFGQINCAVSNRGVVRGLHYGDSAHRLAKYVSCVHGEILDVAADLRVGSPTFGSWDAVRLDGQRHQALYLPEGLGHGYAALADQTVVTFMCSRPYQPEHEHSVHPQDPELCIDWPFSEPTLSDKDTTAPTLQQSLVRGTLPPYLAR